MVANLSKAINQGGQGILAESFLLSVKCPLEFFKIQIVRENYGLKKSKRGSVSLRILAVCLHGLKNCENTGEFLAAFVAFSRVTLKCIGKAHACAPSGHFRAKGEISWFLWSQICPGSLHRASEKLEFCKI